MNSARRSNHIYSADCVAGLQRYSIMITTASLISCISTINNVIKANYESFSRREKLNLLSLYGNKEIA